MNTRYAFAVVGIDGRVVLSRSGHGKILRDYGLERGEVCGGWVSEKGIVTMHNGTVDDVPPVLYDHVECELSRLLGQQVRVLS